MTHPSWGPYPAVRRAPSYTNLSYETTSSTDTAATATHHWNAWIEVNWVPCARSPPGPRKLPPPYTTSLSHSLLPPLSPNHPPSYHVLRLRQSGLAQCLPLSNHLASRRPLTLLSLSFFFMTSLPHNTLLHL